MSTTETRRKATYIFEHDGHYYSVKVDIRNANRLHTRPDLLRYVPHYFWEGYDDEECYYFNIHDLQKYSSDLSQDNLDSLIRRKRHCDATIKDFIIRHPLAGNLDKEATESILQGFEKELKRYQDAYFSPITPNKYTVLNYYGKTLTDFKVFLSPGVFIMGVDIEEDEYEPIKTKEGYDLLKCNDGYYLPFTCRLNGTTFALFISTPCYEGVLNDVVFAFDPDVLPEISQLSFNYVTALMNQLFPVKGTYRKEEIIPRFVEYANTSINSYLSLHPKIA